MLMDLCLTRFLESVHETTKIGLHLISQKKLVAPYLKSDTHVILRQV